MGLFEQFEMGSFEEYSCSYFNPNPMYFRSFFTCIYNILCTQNTLFVSIYTMYI